MEEVKMGVYFDFPAGWWVILALLYLPFLFLFFWRKSYTKKQELKVQVVGVPLVIVISVILEFIGVGLGLWTYFPGNWPVILWLAYLGLALFGYQLLKTIEEFIK